MNKRLFYYLFAVLCTVTLFTSCSDDDGDDTPTVIPIEQEMAGDYKGTMDVYYVGVPDPIASGLSQKVYVTKASDTAVKLELRDFVFFLAWIKKCGAFMLVILARRALISSGRVGLYNVLA